MESSQACLQSLISKLWVYVKPSSLSIYQAIAACWTWGTWNSSTGVLWTLRSTLTLQSHPGLVEGTETWTLPFNVTMSKHLCTSYPLYISNISTLSSPGFDPLSAFFIKHAEKRFGMIVVRVTLKTCCFPFLLTCSICFCQTVSPHIFGTKLKSRLYTRKVQLHPHRIIAC